MLTEHLGEAETAKPSDRPTHNGPSGGSADILARLDWTEDDAAEVVQCTAQGDHRSLTSSMAGDTPRFRSASRLLGVPIQEVNQTTSDDASTTPAKGSYWSSCAAADPARLAGPTSDRTSARCHSTIVSSRWTCRASPNTVQLSWAMVAVSGPVGWGQLLCRARLTCHLTYLRLISRGFDRDRRAGLSRWQSSLMACRQPCSG